MPYHPALPKVAGVYHLINECSRWQDLRGLQHSLGAQLSPLHVVALMSAATKLLASRCRRQAPGAVGRDEGGHLALTAKYASRRLASSVSYEAAGSSDSDLSGHLAYVQGLADTALQLARARELPPRSLSTALWAAAKLPLGSLQLAAAAGRSPSQPARLALRTQRADWRGWAVEMLRCCMPLLGRFTPQDLSLTLWAAATLECAPLPPGLVQAVVEATRFRLATFGPQAISNTLWAFARLRCRPPPDWLHAVCCAAAPQLRAFSAQALANTAYALALLEYMPSEEWCAAFLDSCDALWARVQPAAAGRSSSQDGVGGDTSQVQPQSIALIAWASARLGLRPAPGWVQRLADAAAASAPRMNGQDVANVMWALGVLCFEPLHADAAQRCLHQLPQHGDSGKGPQLKGTSEQLAHRSATVARLGPLLDVWRRCATAMEPQQLSACLVACVRLGMRHEQGQSGAAKGPIAEAEQPFPELLSHTLQCLAAQLPAASGQCVANALWAVARLGWRPPSDWMADMVGRFMECLEDDDAGPQEVANVWWALGRLRWAPSAESIQELLSRSLAAAAAGDLRSGELAMLLWGVAQLELKLPKITLDRLVSIVRHSSRREALSVPQQQREATALRVSHGDAAPLAGYEDTPASDAAVAWQRSAVPPATLVTLLRALSHMGAASQRSTAEAALESSLRGWAATARGCAKTVRGAWPPRRPGHVQLAVSARQVALALHSAASMGVSLAPARGTPVHSRGLAGAVIAAVRAVLPHCNARDLAAATWALTAMEAALSLRLLEALLARAGALCCSGELAAATELAVMLYGLGRLLHIRRRRRLSAAVSGEGAKGSPSPGSVPLPLPVTAGGSASASTAATRKPLGAGITTSSHERKRRGCLAAAKAAVLRAVSRLVQSPASRRTLAPRDLRHLVLGLALCRLVPKRSLLRLLAAAVVRRSAGADRMPISHVASTLRQLAAMGADMDFRVAVVLLRRLRASSPAAALKPHRLVVLGMDINTMVARSVMRQRPRPPRCDHAVGINPLIAVSGCAPLPVPCVATIPRRASNVAGMRGRAALLRAAERRDAKVTCRIKRELRLLAACVSAS